MLALEDKIQHRRFVESVVNVGIGALLEEISDHLLAAVHSRQIQRRLAVGRLRLQRRAFPDECLDGGEVARARGL